MMPYPPNYMTQLVEEQIMLNFEENAQKPCELVKKMELRKAIYERIKTFYVIDLYIVGSSVTGLATTNSDTDMCLVFNDHPSEIVNPNECTFLLDQIKRILMKHQSEFVRAEIINAKVPLLKFFDSDSKVRIDLNISNAVGIRNTHLIKCYADLDVRLAPLVVAVKKWASSNDINNAHRKTISSYSLTLMVINFLQRCKEPVLPCLQMLRPDLFHESADIRRLLLNQEWPKYESSNKKSVSELFKGFLEYYSEQFNFDEWAISVRLGQVILKKICRVYTSPSNCPNDWNYLAVEEPYERTNAARAVHDPLVFANILKVFRESNVRMKSGMCDYQNTLNVNPRY